MPSALYYRNAYLRRTAADCAHAGWLAILITTPVTAAVVIFPLSRCLLGSPLPFYITSGRHHATFTFHTPHPPPPPPGRFVYVCRSYPYVVLVCVQHITCHWSHTPCALWTCNTPFPHLATHMPYTVHTACGSLLPRPGRGLRTFCLCFALVTHLASRVVAPDAPPTRARPPLLPHTDYLYLSVQT